MSRLLDDLTPFFRVLAVELLARLVEAGIPVLIVNTLRSVEEQEVNIKNGVSWTKNSRHLPNSIDGKAQAIDICPYDQFNLHGPDKLNWDFSDAVWQKIGNIGKALGLEWGGDWPNNPPKSRPDGAHFQL